MHPRSFITALILHCYFVLIHKAKIILLIASGFSKAELIKSLYRVAQFHRPPCRDKLSLRRTLRSIYRATNFSHGSFVLPRDMLSSHRCGEPHLKISSQLALRLNPNRKHRGSGT